MSHKELLFWAMYIIGGFLMGSVLFCQVIPQIALDKDIYAISDDHNPGATNVFIQCGASWGFLCLGLDMMKGFLPVFFTSRSLEPTSPLFALVLIAPVLGHAVAPFHHFHGGKCIATTFGEMLALLPFTRIGLVLAVIYIVFSTVVKIQPNRLRSMAAFGLFGAFSAASMLWGENQAIALGCVGISLIAIVKHSKYFSYD